MANTMKLGGNNAFLGVTKTSPTGQLSPASSHVTLNNNNYNLNSFSSMPAYNGSRNGGDFFQSQSTDNCSTLTALNTVTDPRSPSRLLAAELVGTNGSYNLTNLSPALSPSQSMDTLLTSTSSASNFSPQHQANATRGTISALFQTFMTLSFTAYCHSSDGTALMRSLNCASKLDSSSLAASPVVTTATTSSTTSLGTTASQVMGHLLSLNNPLPNDLDFNFDSLQGGLECDVDQVIRHELSVDGSLDFNFDPALHHNTAVSTSGSVSHNPSMASAASSRSWVH